MPCHVEIVAFSLAVKMQIKNARAGLLSNYEVLKLLEEQQVIQQLAQSHDHSIIYPEHLRTIQYELTEYLKKTPAGTQSSDQMQRFLKAFSRFELTLAEKLQIANLRPKSPVEIYLLIEECEERFKEDDLQEMLEIVLSAFPRDDDDDVMEENEPEEQD